MMMDTAVQVFRPTLPCNTIPHVLHPTSFITYIEYIEILLKSKKVCWVLFPYSYNTTILRFPCFPVFRFYVLFYSSYSCGSVALRAATLVTFLLPPKMLLYSTLLPYSTLLAIKCTLISLHFRPNMGYVVRHFIRLPLLLFTLCMEMCEDLYVGMRVCMCVYGIVGLHQRNKFPWLM